LRSIVTTEVRANPVASVLLKRLDGSFQSFDPCLANGHNEE